MTETVVTEIEARDEAERHGKRTTSFVLSEAKRIAEQFVDALRSADTHISKAAKDAQVAVQFKAPPRRREREGEGRPSIGLDGEPLQTKNTPNCLNVLVVTDKSITLTTLTYTRSYCSDN